MRVARRTSTEECAATIRAYLQSFGDRVARNRAIFGSCAIFEDYGFGERPKPWRSTCGRPPVDFCGYGDFKRQIVKSAESIGFNICEGCGAATDREFARFLDISIKSTTELEGQLDYARDYGVISETQYQTFLTETIDIRKMLFGLRQDALGADDTNNDQSE